MSKVKFFLLALVALFFAATVSADVVWSSAFDFDGSEIVEPVELKPTDSIGFTTTVVGGTEKEVSIRAINVNDHSINKLVHYEYAGDNDAEGTVVWNYTSLNIPKNETYTLQECIDSTASGVELNRTVKILPEPAAILILGLVGALFLRRRAKSLLVLLAFVSLGALSAKATATVSVGQCFQMWPFERKVIINYTVSNLTESEYINFYYTTDNGESSYNLRDNGLLTGDVGPISANGNYRVVWTPDTETMASVKGKMKIGVDVYVPELPSTYMVVNLSDGAVSYTDEIPEGGWNVDEYKTTKMAFRLIPAGTFSMGSPSGEEGRQGNEDVHQVTLTKSFYMGVFEVTQKQYELIAGSNPSSNQGNPRPVENVSYNTLRGSVKGAEWPTGTDVDAGSFIGTFRSQTGCDFDLPTEAQWEYACRATTTTALNTGSNLSDESSCPEMDEAGRYFNNTTDRKGDPYYLEHTTVGCYLPNQWGLYDMHGNVAELCLDWKASRLGTNPVTDPVGPTTGDTRIARGGCYQREALDCRSAARTMSAYPSVSGAIIGFRLILTLE